MKTIGITGGVGAGKSLVLNYIKEHYRSKIYMADDIANEIKEPGKRCYQAMLDLLGTGVLAVDGRINKAKMAEMIFADELLLDKVNGILHPAVKEYVLECMEKDKKSGQYDFFILEAALLIEEHYDEILDELWYIRADKEVRRARLKESRGYSDQKIDNIMNNQLPDAEFMKHCRVIIDNNGDLQKTYSQIDENLGEYIGAENE